MKASMDSTVKSRSSSEESSERPDSEGGGCSSDIPTHRSKRRRRQHRNKRRYEDSPDLEIPLTIVEEASGDDDDPPEKKSLEEKISSDEDDDFVMPEVPANEAVMDPVMAFEEEPTDSGVDLEASPSMISLPFLPFCFPLLPLADTFLVSLPADLPQDSDDFEPSMDVTFDNALDEFMEAESIPPVIEEGI
ncbi:hypothetical protein AAC387_Pa04g1662 [Persea americana]